MTAKISNLRNRILNKVDKTEQILHVAEWDEDVKIISLTGRQRARLIQGCMKASGGVDLEKLYVEVVMMATYDPETGDLVFEPGDRDMVGDKNGAAIEAIAQVAMQLSGLSENNLKEAEKN